MDLSQLHDALSSQSFDKVADICDELILQARAIYLSFSFWFLPLLSLFLAIPPNY
jgi:hypothetical protein